MTVPADQKFSGFVDGGTLQHDDIVVGLRDGVNTRFSYQGDPGIYLPLAGGTMEGAIIFGSGLGLRSGTTLGNTLLLQAYNTNTASYTAMGTMTAGNPPTFDLNTTTTIGSAYIYRVGGTDVAVADGGTGASTLTNHGILLGQGTSPVAALTLTNNQIVIGNTGADPSASSLSSLMDSVFGNAQGDLLYRDASGWVVLAPGTSGQFLQTQGAAANPQWVTSATVTPAALTRVDDTNVTLTLGGTPSTALLQATSLTVGWTGTLSGTRGGTGVNNGANTATFAGDLNFANAFTTAGNFAVTQTYTGVTNVTFPTSGTLATTSQIPTGAALTKADDTNVTLTLGGTPATALLQATSLTLGWTGQLSVPRGGSGLSSATAYAVLCGGTTSTGAFQSIASVGTSGQVLTSNGAGALPTFQTPSGGSPWTAGSGTNSALGGDGTTLAAGAQSLAYGLNATQTTAPATGSIAIGNNCNVKAVASGAFGRNNTINTSATYSFVFGDGNSVSAFGSYSYILGQNNVAGGGSPCFILGTGCSAAQNYTYALGNTATTSHSGCVVWGDASASPTTSTAQNQFVLTFAGGVHFYSANTPTLMASFMSTGASVRGTNTNDSAAAGFIGEVISSTVTQGAGVALTTNTPANVTSISLTAGDWDITGNVAFLTATTTTLSDINGWISSASATIPAGNLRAQTFYPSAITPGIANQSFCVPSVRVSLNATTTIYLSVQATFGVSTLEGSGVIIARRAR